MGSQTEHVPAKPWSWYDEECVRSRADGPVDESAEKRGQFVASPIRRKALMVACLLVAAASTATEASAQFRYGPSVGPFRYGPSYGRGFGYPTGPLTPPGMMRPIQPSGGGWGPNLRSTPAPVYGAVRQGIRGVPTILFYPQRAY